MSSRILAPAFSVVLGLLTACGSANSTEPQHPNPNDESHKGNTVEVTEGSANYVSQCAKCHGPTGRGTNEAPAVVGEGALPLHPSPSAKLRKTDFVTAKDVFDFIKTNMPGNAPGSLSDDQYYEILAFDLKANGVDLQNKKVDPTTVSTIRLPGR